MIEVRLWYFVVVYGNDANVVYLHSAFVTRGWVFANVLLRVFLLYPRLLFRLPILFAWYICCFRLPASRSTKDQLLGIVA